MYNTHKFTTIITMVVSCILCSCSKSLATERRITFYSASDQVTQDPKPSLDVTSNLNPKIPIKNIQPKSQTNLIPVLVVGGIVTLGIIVAVISNNKDKDNTVSEDPGLRTKDPEEQKARLFIHLCAHLFDYCANWTGTPEEKATFLQNLTLAAFRNEDTIHNTDLLGSTIMARALKYCLQLTPDDVVNNALNLDPNGPWTKPEISRNLFDQENMDDDFINDVVLKVAHRNKEIIEHDVEKIESIARNIKRNAKQYAQFIFLQLIVNGITISDPELIAFLSTKEDNISQHVVTPEELTNYLKWLSNKLTSTTIKAHKSLYEVEQLYNMIICLNAALIDFWNNGPLTPEQKEELTKITVLYVWELSKKDYDIPMSLFLGSIYALGAIIDEKYNTNFMEERESESRKKCSEELKQQRIKVIMQYDSVIRNADILAAKILSYFSEPVTTTNPDLLDHFPEFEPKDNPNLVTPQRLAEYLISGSKHIIDICTITTPSDTTPSD